MRLSSRSRWRRRHDFVTVRLVEDRRDLFEREAEFSVEQDLLQPLQVGASVPAVPRVVPTARLEQPDSVVVMKGPDRHPCELSYLTDRVTLCFLLHVE